MDLEIYIRLIKLAKYEELRPAAYGVLRLSPTAVALELFWVMPYIYTTDT